MIDCMYFDVFEFNANDFYVNEPGFYVNELYYILQMQDCNKICYKICEKLHSDTANTHILPTSYFSRSNLYVNLNYGFFTTVLDITFIFTYLT